MAVIFHPPFPDFFFPDGIFFGRHLRHLFVIRFIKSTFTTMFTITGITSIIITFIISFKKGQWRQKGIYSCPLNVISDATLCTLCPAFLQKLYCARVSHGMAQFVLKWNIWVFWWNKPHYWKRRFRQYATTLLGDVGILMLLVCYNCSCVGYSYGIVCIRCWTSLVF